MRTEQFSGKVENAYGKTIAEHTKGRLKSVPVTGEFQVYVDYAELVAEKAVPSEDDILKIVNAQQKANARAAETVKALTAEGIIKPDKDAPEVAFDRMVADAMRQNSKLTREKAEAFIKSLLATE